MFAFYFQRIYTIQYGTFEIPTTHTRWIIIIGHGITFTLGQLAHAAVFINLCSSANALKKKLRNWEINFANKRGERQLVRKGCTAVVGWGQGAGNNHFNPKIITCFCLCGGLNINHMVLTTRKIKKKNKKALQNNSAQKNIVTTRVESRQKHPLNWKNIREHVVVVKYVTTGSYSGYKWF